MLQQPNAIVAQHLNDRFATAPAEAVLALALDRFELETSGRVKVNPLALWNNDQIQTYFALHDLPKHPLVKQGYPSIGCWACTSKVEDHEDRRAGRWRDEGREECGIHFNEDGTIERKAG